MAVDLPAIDADGHVQERQSDIRRYLEPPWDRRETAYWGLEQPWDTQLFGTLGAEAAHRVLEPATEMAKWLAIMDEHGMEHAVLFPTGSGNIAKLREVPFATALCRAANDMFAAEYNGHSARAQVVGVLPMQDPAAAATELRRAVTERGLRSAEEGLLPAAVDYVGDDHFLFASDIPHWDSDFPNNLVGLRTHPQLSRETKEKILYRNAQALFGLGPRATTPGR